MASTFARALLAPLGASLAFVLALGVAGPASAALRVVATFPDLADLAREVGGDRVSVDTLAEGGQDPHRVPVKPSFVTKLNRADALVVMGLGLESAFLPALLEVARNPRILPGSEAYVDASLYVTPLEVPTSQSRAQGEVHALGNPHFNLDPVRGKEMVRAIAEGLTRVDPEGAEVYAANAERYRALLDRKIEEWMRLAAPLRGVKVVSYHRDLVYFADRFGLEVVGEIESKPGVTATPAHLEALVARMRQTGTQLVLREVHFEPALAQRVAERAGARVVGISVLAGGLPGAESYVGLIEANLRAVLAALPAG